jgi:hypothetical protein
MPVSESVEKRRVQAPQIRAASARRRREAMKRPGRSERNRGDKGGLFTGYYPSLIVNLLARLNIDLL